MGLKSLLGIFLFWTLLSNAAPLPPNEPLTFFETGEVGKVTGTRNLTIQYRIFRQPSDQAIIVLPGYAENAQKYYELIRDFARLGFSVYILDHRGMGASGREVRNRQVVHVKAFDDYVSDLEVFYKQVVEKGPETHRYLFTHSTGGLIGAKFMAKFPGAFRRAVLSAPLFQLNTGFYPKWLAGGLAFALDSVGNGEDYAPGFSDYDPSKAAFGNESFTSSQERFDAYTALLIENPLLVMGGPSVHWIREILRETSQAKISALAKRVSTPLLVYQAGQDALVVPQGQNLFCKTARSCKIVRYPRARHEIYREVDNVRTDAIHRAASFYLKP